MKQLVVGVLAHVDAGKTTLSEAMLYTSGMIRKLGRVDHQNAFLDTDAIEKERGITIFSKQAVLDLMTHAFFCSIRPVTSIFQRKQNARSVCSTMRCLSSAEQTVCRDIRKHYGGYFESIMCRRFCS